MKASAMNKFFGNGSISKLALVLVWVGGIAVTKSVLASNPWGRAVGEAQCLHDVTEDLRNRANRLFPGCPATMLTCAIDESACRLLEMVKCGADWGQLQVSLQAFGDLSAHLCQAVASDCHMSRDRSIGNFLRMVDDRYGDLVRDLSKCKVPVPSCHSTYPNHYQSSYPPPYSSNGYDAYPNIPQPVLPQTQPNNVDPRYMNPNVNPNANPTVPQYWQGSLPRDSYYPRSTYDFDRLSSNRDVIVQSNIGRSVPIDRTPVDRLAAEHPVASEILSLLLSRAVR